MQTLGAVQSRFDEMVSSKSDPLGFKLEALAEFLPAVSPEAKRLTEPDVLAVMKDYMAFAWGKALDHRGISTSRSVIKMSVWLWILGDVELLAFAENSTNYRNYGVPILRKISQKYNFEIPEEAKSWKDGEPCQPNCEDGCAHS